MYKTITTFFPLFRNKKALLVHTKNKLFCSSDIKLGLLLFKPIIIVHIVSPNKINFLMGSYENNKEAYRRYVFDILLQFTRTSRYSV